MPYFGEYLVIRDSTKDHREYKKCDKLFARFTRLESDSHTTVAANSPPIPPGEFGVIHPHGSYGIKGCFALNLQ